MPSYKLRAMAIGLILVLPSSYPAHSQDSGTEPSASARRQAMVARIDELIDKRLAAEGITPAALASDAEFFRRANLDLTGVIPRGAEVRAFLAESADGKRAQTIDRLLASPAHATHLANTFRQIMLPGGMDIERINNVVGVQNWLRQRFVDNLRYDNLVSDLLIETKGNNEGPALYYTSLDVAPEKLAASTARIFLGLQIECAQCHDHPFDHWKQRDFWGYAAFFAQLRQPDANQPGMMVNLVDLTSGDVMLPETDEVIPPRYPSGGTPDDLGTRRQQLAIWIASRDNPYLPRAAVNRAWWILFGRGIVEPVDDLGPQNPPSHPELLDELTQYFVDSGFDLRELLRTIASTRAYQRTSEWTAGEPPAPELFARMTVKSLSADQLYDSVNRVLHRRGQGMMPGSNVQSPLLDPERQAFIAKMDVAGRSPLEYQAGVLQALTLLNGKDLADATHPERSPLLGAVEAPFLEDQQRIDALFLATLSRLPNEDEAKICSKQLADRSASDHPAVWSDILWALLNSAEFALNH
ncbi:MAG: DUF1549 and DUF1553 domain-containing protein [Pirellulaceae bacterium]|nr:DUF1549 and DUF1553 domain-containing protein [Pirellulaceae bacterium]